MSEDLKEHVEEALKMRVGIEDEFVEWRKIGAEVEVKNSGRSTKKKCPSRRGDVERNRMKQ